MNLTPLDEHRLIELKQVVAARVLTDARRPRWRLLRPALAIAAATGAAAIALVATGGGGGTPAFAVTRNAAGMVTVTLTDYRHTAQLSQELRRLGVPAAVFYIPQGQYCYEGSAREVPDPPKGLYTVPTALPAGDGWQLRISTALLKPGQTLLFGLSIGTTKLPRDHPPGVRSNKFYASSTYLITGQATACQFRPEPPAQVPPQVANSGRTVVVDEAGEFLFPIRLGQQRHQVSSSRELGIGSLIASSVRSGYRPLRAPRRRRASNPGMLQPRPRGTAP